MIPRTSPDVGTVLESLDEIRDRYGEKVHLPSLSDGPGREPQQTAVEPVSPTGSELAFRPVMRPATPRLTILDDGELLAGETVRLRQAVTVIGRSHCDVRIPHDPLVSKRHAEVLRETHGAQSRWFLRDRDSANGTFVSCSSSVLHPDRLLILGSHRFRFRIPGRDVAPPAIADGTSCADLPREGFGWPSLVATTDVGSDGVIKLSSPTLTVGRPKNGNDIEIDDPLIANRHAVIARQPSGEWTIKALPSRNGVWVQINAIRLSNLCRFQCGEQRFVFTLSGNTTS